MRSAEVIERLLALRGISAAEVEGFLNPSLSSLAKPEDLPGVSAAAEVVLAALAEGRKAVVFGDYDCDGICATAILTRTLAALGAKVEPFLPDRLTEGYGMSDLSVARCLREHPDVGLVITVDNGINSVDQIASLRAKGVAVVVTDHHLPGPELPAADALVDPKVSAGPGTENLCGAGVAFLLANRLVSEARRLGRYSGPSVAGPLLVLAGLATVTDIMPLLGSNRILVSEALARFRTLAPIGLKELHDRASRSGAERLVSKDFSFVLGPRINAAGRLKSGMEALELILSDDREIARELARIVDGYNVDRKMIELKMAEEAMGKVVPGAPAQVIDMPDGHPGVAGIVAARVLEKLGGKTPVCVLAGGRGSARSPAGINIRDAFVACDAYLERYGGHAAAGGFSVREGQVDAFRRALCDYCRALPESAATQAENEPDLWLEYSDLSLELAEAVARLEPFGEGNREPVFGLRGMRFLEIRPLGAEGRHLAAMLSGRLRAVWWGAGERVEELRKSSSAPYDVTFNLIVSDYGERHAELRLLSATKAQ